MESTAILMAQGQLLPRPTILLKPGVTDLDLQPVLERFRQLNDPLRRTGQLWVRVVESLGVSQSHIAICDSLLYWIEEVNMKAHKGMRPQDIAILLYLSDLASTDWKVGDVAKALHISQSEVSEALHRCQIARLLDKKHKKVYRAGLLEFVIHGLKYVFPVVPGAVTRGIPTAHAAPPLNEQIVQGSESFVWPYAEGTQRGQEILPLYPTLPAVVADKPGFYALLALCDAIRIGRAREVNLAREELTKRILHHA